jgi:uncharacterized protein (DUF2236 family)
MASKVPEGVPPELYSVFGWYALAAGGANVIMQLSRLPVGHGVAKSRVDSGRVDKHPIKRLRTTTVYLALTALGTEKERRILRAEVNRAHKQVRSDPSDPVSYNAFDPELQLWVAACLYKGTEDVYLKLHGHPIPPDRVDAVYEFGKRLGTTLQVPYDMWPTDRQAFETYWQSGLEQVQMDDLTRTYLQGIADMSFVVAPLGRVGRPFLPLLRRFGRLPTLGYLPERIRAELGLPWTPQHQRRFDAYVARLAAICKRLPGPLQRFPLNFYLLETRLRIRFGRRIV